jgi:hypothetical protein
MLIPVMGNNYQEQRAIKNIAKHLTVLSCNGSLAPYKPGNKDFCRSIPETSEYFKQVISAFYKTEGRKWSECFTQSEELHYCWIAIDLKLDRDRPLEIYAYTGKSGAIWGRLCHSTHGTLELDRGQKILIHATKSSDESHAALTSADEFGELDGKATVPQVEQSNINAIRAVRSIKLLNRKDEDTNRIINPVLFKKMKQIERMAEQLNKKLLKLRQVWLEGNLVPTVTSEQIHDALYTAINEWYEKNADRIDTERDLILNLPPLKDKIKLEAADAEAVEKTKQILREIKGCEIFHNDELGLKYCFKHVFNTAFSSCLDFERNKNFVWKIIDLEDEITLEQATKRSQKRRLREAVARRSKGLSEKMKRLKYRKEVWKEMEKLKRNIKETEKAIRESIELGNTEKANGYTSGLWWLKEDLEKHRSEWKRLKGQPLENTKNVHLLSDAAETEMHVNVFYANKYLQTRGRRRNKHFVRH